jgi:hypothetical protein
VTHAEVCREGFGLGDPSFLTVAALLPKEANGYAMPVGGTPSAIGPFQLVRRLGGGGMGEVFLGRSKGGRLVAVKVIRVELAGDPVFRARFAREVAAARKVNGLFTASVVDADVDGPQPWLATIYVPGPSLAEAVGNHGSFPPASVLALAAALAESLAAIHAVDVVHRDLSPRNVLLTQNGPMVRGDSSLTAISEVLGSPGFMSPEQAAGLTAGRASDMFSLGAVLTFAATGTGPFGAGPASELVYRAGHSPPEIGRLSGQLRHVVEQCLQKDPYRRPTAHALLAQLESARPTTGWLPASLAKTLTLDARPEYEAEEVSEAALEAQLAGFKLQIRAGAIAIARALPTAIAMGGAAHDPVHAAQWRGGFQKHAGALANMLRETSKLSGDDSLRRSASLAADIARLVHDSVIFDPSGIHLSVIAEDQLDRLASALVTELSGLHIDVSGADLRDLRQPDIRHFAGIVWNKETMWAPDFAAAVRAWSEPIPHDRFRITGNRPSPLRRIRSRNLASKKR